MLLRLPSLAICERSYQEAGTTLRPFARYRSLPFFRSLPLGGGSLPPIRLPHPSEVLAAFNECHPGCPPGVYFYDASEIRLTSGGWGGGGEGERRYRENENGTKRRLRSENFFFYVCSFSPPALQLPELSLFLPFFFPFSRGNSSTDLSSENDTKRTGRRGFEDSSGGVVACTRNVLRI